MTIKKIFLERGGDGKTSVDVEYTDRYNIDTDVIIHVFDILRIDEYYLIIDVAKNKTIKVLKSNEEVITYLGEYGKGAEIEIVN